MPSFDRVMRDATVTACKGIFEQSELLKESGSYQYRVVLSCQRKGNGKKEYVTYLLVYPEDAAPYKVWGHYFNEDSMQNAVEDFIVRSDQAKRGAKVIGGC
jgi:hypothetical protein